MLGGYTYFISASAYEKRYLPQSERMATLFIDVLQHYREERHYLLHAFVVMPNHVHVILTTAPGTTLEKAVQLIKGSFSCRMQKELGKRCSIWQPGYFDYRIRDAADFEVRWQYVHDDPVRKHLVERPEGFPYSSANPKYTVDEIPQWLKPLSITPR